MVGGVDLFDDLGEDSVFVEDEGLADRAHHGLAVHLLLAPRAKSLQHLRRGIGQQPERQLVLGPENSVIPRPPLKLLRAQKEWLQRAKDPFFR